MADLKIDNVVQSQMKEVHDLILKIREAPVEKFEKIKEEYIKLLKDLQSIPPEEGSPEAAFNELLANISVITQDFIMDDICDVCFIWKILFHGLWFIAESRQHEGVTLILNKQRFRNTGKRILRKHLSTFRPRNRSYADCDHN